MQEIKGTLRGTFANFRHMARNSRHRARTPAIRSPMREKELRFALICYGGISLAVYMHGITKEVWRLSAESRAFHDGEAIAGSGDVYPASGRGWGWERVC